MARISPLSPKVFKKATPVVILAIFIFISLMFLIEYTEAATLVILAWIILPVVAVKIYRRLRSWHRKGDDT